MQNDRKFIIRNHPIGRLQFVASGCGKQSHCDAVCSSVQLALRPSGPRRGLPQVSHFGLAHQLRLHLLVVSNLDMAGLMWP